jgi:hypothetical protein
MPLFPITNLYDEGISSNVFRVVEAESKLAIALVGRSNYHH